MVMLETVTNGYRPGSLDIASLLSVLLAIWVIISKNPIVSVLFLIGLFMGIAFYLLLLGITFIGLSYLLVYVGAVSILFLFILMLINVRVSELTTDTTNSIPLVLLVSVLFSFPAKDILPSNSLSEPRSELANIMFENISTGGLKSIFHFFSFSNTFDKTSFVTSKLWDGNLAETSHITSIGGVMYSSYSIWLIITSIILLLAMVGCIVITIKKNSNGA